MTIQRGPGVYGMGFTIDQLTLKCTYKFGVS